MSLMVLVVLLLPLVLGLECPTCQDKDCDKTDIPSHICRVPTVMRYLPNIYVEEYKVVLHMSPKYFQCLDLEYIEGHEKKKQKGCEVVPKGYDPCKLWSNDVNIVKCTLFGETEELLEKATIGTDGTKSTISNNSEGTDSSLTSDETTESVSKGEKSTEDEGTAENEDSTKNRGGTENEDSAVNGGSIKNEGRAENEGSVKNKGSIEETSKVITTSRSTSETTINKESTKDESKIKEAVDESKVSTEGTSKLTEDDHTESEPVGSTLSKGHTGNENSSTDDGTTAELQKSGVPVKKVHLHLINIGLFVLLKF